MRAFYILLLSIVSVYMTSGQDQNSADILMSGGSKLRIGGYAQIDYNQPISNSQYLNGKLDVHRLVLLFNYKFNDKTQFLTELEYEHVSEVFVEQAFLQHRFNKYFNLRAGLLLIPMGIINEFHEPSTYRGVERPNVDKFIVPTTWREIGVGFSGRFDQISLKYQAYLVNGFKSFDGEGLLKGSNGLRSGRQKGIESFSSSPNVSVKIDHYGFKGLRIGIAGYFGKTQSTLYNGIDKNNNIMKLSADSTTLGTTIIGLDARYKKQGFQVKGQYIIGSLSNTEQYNQISGKDIGKQLSGYYVELSYDVLYHLKESKMGLYPFFRFEHYDTHFRVDETMTKNPAYNRTDITFGLDWKLTNGAVIKGDYQLFYDQAGGFMKQINLGVAAWFN